jgi:hypothetical protein
MGNGAARVINTLMDLSAIVQERMKGYVMMVVRMERGDVGVPHVVTSLDDCYAKYGKKVSWSNDPLIVELALKLGAKLILTQAAHYTDVSDKTSITATKAGLILMDRGLIPLPAIVESTAGPFSFTAAASGSTLGSEVGPYIFATGVSDAMKLAVGSGADQPVTLVGSSIAAQAVCDQINAQTTDLTASVVDNKVNIASNDLADSLTVKAVAADAYSVLGFNEDVYDINAGTDLLTISIGGGADQDFTLTGTGATFSLTSSQVVAQLTALTSATATSVQGKVRFTSTATGGSASVQVKDTSTAIMGFITTVVTGHTGTSHQTLELESVNEAECWNGLRANVYVNALDPENKFDLRIDYLRQSDMREDYTGLTMDSTDVDNYAVTVINLKSRMVKATNKSSANEAPSNLPLVTTLPLEFTGGDNGGAMTDADWIGNSVAQTGMYALDNAPYISIDFMVPGSESHTVAAAMAAYAESRGDLHGYFKVPAFLDPEDAIAWRMGNSPYSHAAFDSMRLVIMYGDVLVYDDLDNSYKYVSCLGHFAAKITLSDANYGEAYAIAGDKRGKVGLVEGLYIDIMKNRVTGYADLFAEYGINYLMISTFPGDEGAVFWEQRTSQIQQSSTRNLNVARFCTTIFVMLTPVLRSFIFDQNHPVTWREVDRLLVPVFDKWCENLSIYTYMLQTDKDAYFGKDGLLHGAVLNDGLGIDQGSYRCRTLIQPVQAITHFYYTVGVTRTGTAFSEYSDMKTLPGTVRR